MFSTSPENAQIVTKLEEELEAISLGDLRTYQQLSRVAGRNIKNSRWLLVKAVDNAEKKLSCAFACVRKVGIKRLTTDEAPEIGLVSIKRVRGISKRGKKRLQRVNTNSMSDSAKRHSIGYIAMLGAIGTVADARRATAIAAVADPAKPIPPENILDMFRQKF